VGLKQYRAKRHFSQTPEPQGKDKGAGTGPLRFVVHKHQASRLHYDFRLELQGTLKSWAVPKGPSLDPADKRLAIQVEDHPLEYGDFEGTIPEGNYGAGTVMIWDRGYYLASDAHDRAESEKQMAEGLELGRLRFVLQGEKLQGEFVLVRLSRGKPNEWLLIKHGDSFASEEKATGEDRSAASGRTMAEIAAGFPKREWQSDKPAAKRERRGPKIAVRPAPSSAAPSIDLQEAPLSAPPHNVQPMLASPVDRPFDKPGWLFEIKWDGYRAIAEVESGRVRLYSRKLLSFNERYPGIVQSLAGLGHDAVLDGEVVVLDEQGEAHFHLLQQYQKTGQGVLVYYVFDLLYLDRHDLCSLPLRRRKEILASLVDKVPSVRLSEHMEEKGKAFFEVVARRGLEGIIAKNAASRYRQGLRSHDWLKIRTEKRQEAVIGGFTRSRGSRPHFGALVLGVYQGNDLVYAGHTGTGLSDATLAEVRAQLEPLITKTCPFRQRPRTNAPATWVRPEMVCEVNYQQWTEDGHMRFPVFLGLRPDKPARSVVREMPEPLQNVARAKSEQEEPVTVSDPPLSTPVTLHLTNLDKVYWPGEGYTKGDLIDYYRKISSWILPYLRDRPENLNRHPRGIEGKSFFQKDMKDQAPPWASTADVSSESRGETIRYLICNDQNTLLYMANLGCIEINPWSSRLGALNRPDWLVIDLDPETIDFAHVVEAAQEVHRLLDRAGAGSVCKTSGKTGLHIYVPLGARYDYNQATQFAQIVATIVQARLPASTSVVRMPAQRQHRVYLDFLQNRRGQTLAAPYSVRPAPGGTVSTPLRWSEVRRGLDPGRFTLRTLPQRLAKLGDLWKPVLGPGIDLQACLDRLQKMGNGSRAT
jgi:bifunctional non-homologous end joining protein LigD